MFGLSNYESRTYLALLSSGIRTAKEVSDESKIPFGRIYDVLSSLEDKGLVDTQDSRPKKFIAKKPKTALNNLLSMKQAEVSSLTKKAVIIEEKLSDLHTTKDEESLFWSVALGDNAIPRYIEKISEAENTLQLIINIRVAARLPRKEIITNLTDRIKFLSKRKVSVQILLIGMTSQILEEEYVGTMAKFFEVLDKAEVKHTQLNPMAFDIIDDEKVLLKVMNPVKPDEFFAWIFVWQKKIALELKTKFQELWASAIELK